MVILQKQNFSLHNLYIINSSTININSLNKSKYNLIFKDKNKFPIKYPYKYRYLKMIIPDELVPNHNFMKKELKELIEDIKTFFGVTYYQLRIIQRTENNKSYYLELYYTDRVVEKKYKISKVDKYYYKKSGKVLKKYKYNENNENHIKIVAGSHLNGDKQIEKWGISPSRSSRKQFVCKMQECSKKIVLRLNNLMCKLGIKKFFLYYTDYRTLDFKTMFKFKKMFKDEKTKKWKIKIFSSKIKTNKYFNQENEKLLNKDLIIKKSIRNYTNYIYGKLGYINLKESQKIDY